MPPVSKPDSIDQQVSKAYGELKDGINDHSIQKALTDINTDMHNMTPAQWSQFNAKLQDKINSTDQMLPELTILTTEKAFANQLSNGGRIDQSDFQKKLEEYQIASEMNGTMDGKSSFTQGLLQSFLDKDFNTVKDETCRFHDGTCVSTDDLEQAFKEKLTTASQNQSGSDALTGLEKSNAASFKALADEDLNLTKDSIQSALNKNANAVKLGLPATLDDATKDLAGKLLDDKNKLFDNLGDGDTITVKSLDSAAAKAGKNVDDLRKATDKKTGDADGTKTDPKDGSKESTKPGAKDGTEPQPKSGQPGSDHGGKSGGAGSDKKAHEKAPAAHEKYVVKHGDDLTHIARHRLIGENGVAPTQAKINQMVAHIVAQNHITNPDYIRDGQVLQF